ncbi:MAG: hypothetical protein KatS3mg118_0485 [Paracoccaceae bacterium]|nr:MAG: hypothetical protein KatS3mg118_0485 [Paracoccaceae bacterium]
MVLGLVAAMATWPPARAPAQGETLGPVTRRPLPRFVSLRKRANVRRGPGTQHRIDWVFHHPGMPLRVVAEFDVWRKVVDWEGAGGWVHQFFLRGDRTVVVTADEAALRERPDPAAPVVARALRGAFAAFRRCAGPWCLVEADGIEGWLRRDAVWGVGPED